jgi:CHRD domain
MFESVVIIEALPNSKLFEVLMKTAFVLALVLLINSAAFASPITFNAVLNAANEFPPNPSPATGMAMVIIDPAAHLLTVSASFSGLTTPSTAAHIHCCTTTPFSGTAGVATQLPAFSNFPLGATSGSFTQTYDTTQALLYNPAFVTAQGGLISQAEAVLFAGMFAGTTYFNIHTQLNGGGEIRGFLVQAPEPSSALLLACGLLGLLGICRKRSRI